MEHFKQNIDVTFIGASGTPEPAIGGGTHQKLSSVSQNLRTGMAGQVIVIGNITRTETAVSLGGTQHAPLSDNTDNVFGNKISNSEPSPGASTKSTTPGTINIGILSKEELLDMLQSYVNSTKTFADKTSNVHKELKETLENSEKVLIQYLRVKSSGPKENTTKKVIKSTRKKLTRIK